MIDRADIFGERSYDEFCSLMKQRVGKKRFLHCLGVADTAANLAKLYDVDVAPARTTGLLHDWDKGLDNDAIRARVRELHVDADPVIISDMPWLLHGPTAAAALKREYPELGDRVFQAIARHTTGALDMQPLDCIIYIADIIEPNRTFGDEAGMKALTKRVGKEDLDKLYFYAFKYTIGFLVDRNKQLAPQTFEIWNHLVKKYRKTAMK